MLLRLSQRALLLNSRCHTMLSCCFKTTAVAQMSASTPAVAEKQEEALVVKPPDGQVPPQVPAGFAAACLVSDLPEHGLAEFMLRADTPICIIRQHGVVKGAILSLCPHKQASLACGDIEDGPHGCAVKCPRHRKKFPGGLNFDVSTGHNWVGPNPRGEPCNPEYREGWSVPVFDTRTLTGKDGREWLAVSEKPLTGKVERGKSTKSKAAFLQSELSHLVEGSFLSSPAGLAAGIATGSSFQGSYYGQEEEEEKTGAVALHVVQRHSPGLSSAPGSRRFSHGMRWATGAVQAISRDTHDTLIYTVQLQDKLLEEVLARVNPHSWHVSVSLGPAPSSRAEPPSLSREYTPISTLDDLKEGRLTLLVKIYPQGKLTSQLAKLGVGDVLSISEPETTLGTPDLLPPTGSGVYGQALPASSPNGSTDVLFTHGETKERLSGSASTAGSAVVPGQVPSPLASKARRTWPVGRDSTVLLVAGGTGVTPVLQLAKWAVSPSADPDTVPGRVLVLVSNKTAGDILVRPALANLAASAQGRLTVMHTLTRDKDTPVPTAEEKDAGVRFSCGRVSRGLVEGLVGSAALQRVVVSGPAGMFESVRQAVVQAGHREEILVELEA